ncbi:NAD(P)/FAD-dependent oxidoreductase [Parasediminibacterium sp. JCM 36343]|uniref:NAD(P)/FAD-dependent oxidoreductase n=1 Tax=Parasediminibacterium sp. JCM 36343 TaxID=3374279 RepID=UPI00397B5B70
MEVDYIIVGQGISGSFLSWYLIQAGKKVMVIDQPQPYTASKVASGVINPVTGRRIVSTWMIETLMPFALDAYTNMGETLGANLISQANILDFHPTPQMKLAFEERLPVENKYLRYPDNATAYEQYFNYYFGIGEINPCYLIDVNLLLDNWRKALKTQNALLEETFDINKLVIANSSPLNTHHSPLTTYNLRLTTKKLIFCDGAAGFNNPYFSLLPYAKNKGEAIITEIKDLPRNNIYKQGINIVPWKDNLWWIGSTYEWDFKDLNPTPAFRAKVEQQLSQWLKLPYTIVDHIASERPANLERRPFVGFHPKHPNIGILNGMGTKGCSLAPYFAKQLADNLVNGTPLLPQADVQRFSKVLSR